MGHEKPVSELWTRRRGELPAGRVFVDRILRGTKAGDIPLEEPARLDIGVNLKAARQAGVEVPRSILTQATRVID